MIGYLDTPSGISGDMLLGCLIDAGWPIEQLRDTIARLDLPEGTWSVSARFVQRGPLRATFADVQAEEPEPPHRGLADIRRIIENAELPAAVKDGAVKTFQRLAAAEAKVHGTSVEAVHFHEVGAIDAIIDIVGAAAGLHALDIGPLHASPLPLGAGWVTTEHGRLPAPAPATLELLAAAGAPTRPAPGDGELVTPTGAALLAQFAEFRQPPMTIERIGVGCGRREFDWPNIARLWLGQPLDAGPFVEMETNIDDMNPQFYASVSERLFAAGALDVWTTAIQMKKGRPAVKLSVLGPASRESELADLMLRETTTLGVRARQVHRHEARRERRSVTTPYGEVAVKLKWLGEECIGAAPEYEDCLRLAKRHHLSLRAMFDAALAAARSAIPPPG